MESFEERTVSGLTIRIDRNLCAATQNCIKVAPEVFVLAEDQIVTFLDETEDIERSRLIEACAVCPTDTFTIFDEEGNEVSLR